MNPSHVTSGILVITLSLSFLIRKMEQETTSQRFSEFQEVTRWLTHGGESISERDISFPLLSLQWFHASISNYMDYKIKSQDMLQNISEIKRKGPNIMYFKWIPKAKPYGFKNHHCHLDWDGICRLGRSSEVFFEKKNWSFG